MLKTMRFHNSSKSFCGSLLFERRNSAMSKELASEESPSVRASCVIAEEKWMRFIMPSFVTRSNRLERKQLLPENFSKRDSATFNPASTAKSFTVFSHAQLSSVSFLEGNFAIHKLPSTSFTVAFGRAPPSDEPGSRSW